MKHRLLFIFSIFTIDILLLMKQINLFTSITIIALLILSNSCTVEKRLHTGGYHVKFKKSLKGTDDRVDEKMDGKSFIVHNKLDDKIKNQEIEKLESFAVNNISDGFVEQKDIYESSHQNKYSASAVETKSTNPEPKEKCDNIILNNGDEISAKVLEISEYEIKYKKCENLQGPFYTIDKSRVFMIQYANGTKDVFKIQETSVRVTEVKAEAVVAENTTNVAPIAVLSFILAVLGFLIALLLSAIVGLIFLVIAAILGIIAVSVIQQASTGGRGLGVASILIGIIGGLITLFFILSETESK